MNKSAQRGLSPLILIAVIGIAITGIFFVTKISPKKLDQTTQKQQEVQKSPNLYSNFDEGLNMQPLSNWETKKSSEINGLVKFVAPAANTEDKFQELVALYVEDIAVSGMTFEEFKEKWISSANKVSQGSSEIISQEKITMAGTDAYKIVLKFQLESYLVKELSYLLSKNGKVYLLKYLAEEKSFDKFLPDAEKIMQSMKFEPQEVKWQTYKSNQYGYSVKIPTDWKVTDKPSETSRETTIVHPQGKALVLVTALKDDRLKDIKYLRDSVSEFKTELENDPTITKLADFKDQYIENRGAFIARGLEKREGKDWYFEQRGILSTNGTVLLFHGSVLGSLNKEYLNIIADIIESFKTD